MSRERAPGTAAIIAVVIDASCSRCDFWDTFTAGDTGPVRKFLRDRGWRMRYGKWVCPVCCRTRRPMPHLISEAARNA